MKRTVLVLAALAAGAVWAANDGSKESKAVTLTASSTLKSAAVPKLFLEEVKDRKGSVIGTNFVYYFKMKLKKGTAYTVYLDGEKDASGHSAPGSVYLTEDGLYPKFAFTAPIAMFERTEVGDSARFVMTGKEWGIDWDDGGWTGAAAHLTSDSAGEGLDEGWDDWDDWKTPNTWDYYIRVVGNEGATATLHYATGKKIPTGIRQNPLVLTVTTTPQVTVDPNDTKARPGSVKGEMQFWSSNYYCQVSMKLGCRYHFTSSKGSEANALSVAYLDIDGTVRTNQEEVSAWDFAETFVPRKSGTYLVEITSTASNYVNATGKMTYWVEPEKALSKHAFRKLTADVPITDCCPGNINAKLIDGATGDNTNKYFDAIIDEELFSFTAAKGKNYVIETTGAETNLIMRVYDSKGAVLMENFGNGSNFNVRCAISAPSKKTTYYVGVAQDFGYDDDLGRPTRKPVTLVQRTIASTNLGNLKVDPVPTSDGDDPAARDEGVVIPQLGADNWYDTYAFKAHAFKVDKKNVLTYAFCATWAEENPPTNGYHLVADVYMLKSGKQKAVHTGLDITPTATNEISNVITFEASATTTYYVKLRVKEGYALDYPQVRLHAIGYATDGADAIGRLTVIPEGTASAKWTLDKESTKYAIGDSILLPTGKVHTVKFTSVSGFTKPSDCKVSVVALDTVTVEGLDARYVDSVEAKKPNDNTASGATKWTLKQNKATSYARTLWYYGKGGADKDPADYYLITPKDGRYYQFALAPNGCNAAFDIYRADGRYFASNETSVAKLQLPTSKSKYYVIVHRNRDVAADAEGEGAYKVTGQYAEVGTISFAKASVSVKDNANTVKLTVKRSAKDGKVAVRYYTKDGTAKAGEHYVAQTNVLTWAAKNKSDKTITIKMIPKLGAWCDGGDKNFTVVLEPVEIGAESDYVAQIKTPECLVTRTETGLDKKKKPITQESVYAKAAAKVATVKKSENAPLETGVFYGVGQNTTNYTYGQTLTNGLPEFAAVTLTSAISKGKTNLTAKVSVGGKSYTFKGVGWDACDGDIAESRMTLMTTVNKKAYTNVLDVYVSPGCTTNEEAWLVRDCGFSLVLNVPDANGKGVQTNMLYRGDLCRRNAGIQDYLNVVTNFAGYYTATLLPDGFARTDRSVLTPEAAEMAGLPLGNGYLTLTVDNKGTVKVAGKLADGTSVSTSVTAAPIARDSGSPLGWKMFVPLYSAKSPYVLCGLLRIVAQEAQEPRPDGRAWDLVVRAGRLFWNNDSGTVTYDGTQGYRVGLTSVGGWYDKIVNLQSYYRDYAYRVRTMDEISEFPKEVLPSGYDFVAVGPNDVGVELSGNGLDAPARKLTKTGKTYMWAEAVNPCNVKVKLARATGIVSGTLSLWGEKPGTKPVAKELTGFKHYGILTMDRAAENALESLYSGYEVFTAGFLLKDVKIPVTTKKSRTWKFSTPFDIVLPVSFDD